MRLNCYSITVFVGPAGQASAQTNTSLNGPGYGHEHNTWEPENNIPNALIEEYWEDQAARAVRRANHGVGGARSTRRG